MRVAQTRASIGIIMLWYDEAEHRSVWVVMHA